MTDKLPLQRHPASLANGARDAQITSMIRDEASKSFGIKSFTCDTCSDKHDCRYAFDPYNTNDDCLAEK